MNHGTEAQDSQDPDSYNGMVPPYQTGKSFFPKTVFLDENLQGMDPGFYSVVASCGSTMETRIGELFLRLQVDH